MKTITKNYQEQAEKFLESVGATMKVAYIENGPYFDDDKETKYTRDIYRITLIRGEKRFSFKFGQSIDRSNLGKVEPTSYDVLSCLQKYEVGTFADFCSDFGYDEDSRKAEKTYKAVLKEWAGVQRLFGDVLDQLAEIQ